MFVQGQGTAGNTVDVQLLARDETDRNSEPTLLDSKPVTLHEDGVPAQVVFEQTPTIAASIEFVVRLQPDKQITELSIDDNERRRSINVFERKTRVMLIAGGPMREYRFVRNMLYRHPGMRVDVWLQTVDTTSLAQVSQESSTLLSEFPQRAADLFEYDVVVAFDPDWNRLNPDQYRLLTDWVSRHAGGLILLAGDVHTSELASATDDRQILHELYPVFLNPTIFQTNHSRSQAWSPDFTADGMQAGFLSLSDDTNAPADSWKQFEGVYHCYPTGGPKAGATVLAHFSDPRTQTEHGQPILMATQYYGAGRTLFVGTPEIWRLRSLSDEFYDRFWIRAIREVGQGRTERGRSRGLLLIERNQFVLGQTVRVRAQLYDAQLSELEADSVPAEIFDSGGAPLAPTRRLLRDPNRPGQYVGSFRASRPGTWRIEVPVPDSTQRLVKKIDVVLPNLESDNPRQNRALLSRLVQETGGRYLTLDEAAAALPTLFTDHSEQHRIDERLRTLWDRQWVLWLLTGLLSLEWLTRKLLQLA